MCDFPLGVQSWLLRSKGNSKCLIQYFAHYCLKNVCYPYLSFLANYPKPRYNPWLLSWVLCISIVEFEFGMSIWCHWFSHLSSSIPFMRSYLNMPINSGNCVLCDTYMWAFVFISTSILSHITSIGCVVRKSEWK